MAHETGTADVVDPLGGSYYVESLTNEMEVKLKETLNDLEKAGGIVHGITTGRIQKELARQSYFLQKKIDSGEKVLVGVNKFRVKEEERDLEIYRVDPDVRSRQIERLKQVRNTRDRERVLLALDRLKEAAAKGQNIIPFLFEPRGAGDPGRDRGDAEGHQRGVQGALERVSGWRIRWMGKNRKFVC